MNNQEQRTGSMTYDEILGVVNDAVNDIKKEARQLEMEKFAKEHGGSVGIVNTVKPEDEFVVPDSLATETDSNEQETLDIAETAGLIDYSQMKEESAPESNKSVQESISNSMNKIGDIFGTTIKDIRQSKQLEAYDAQMNNLINIYSEALTGAKLDTETRKRIIDGIISKGKAVSELSEIEIDSIYAMAGISFKDMSSKLKEDVNPTDVKREFLDVLYQTNGFSITMDKYKEELQKNAANTQNEIDELLSSLDVLGELENLQKQIAEEKDPEQKKLLQNTYAGLYSAVYLGFIKDKLENKPFKVILKECEKEYDRIFKKARKIMDNSKEQFLDIKNLRQHLTLLFPLYEVEVKVLVFLICKKICKRKEISTDLVAFINYFILNVTKLISKMFTDKEKTDTMNNIEDILKFIKEKRETK